MKILLLSIIKKLTTLFLFCFISNTLAQTNAWINEIHYDNDGGDINEAIEIVIENPGDLSLYRIDLYNGNGGGSYDNETVNNITVGNVEGSFHLFTWVKSGIQNGAPDGIALSYNGSLIQFLSYEGSFTAVGGPADGAMSTDIGVTENGSTAIGESLQLSGTGIIYEDFIWQSPATSTFGSLNNDQSLPDYAYVDGSWSPNDPSDMTNGSDATSLILVKNGTATVAGDFVGGEFFVSPNATFSLDTGLTATLNSLSIESDATFVLGNAATLNMEGNITNSGTADFKNGNVSFNVLGGNLVAGGNGVYDFRNLTLQCNNFTFRSPNTSIFGLLFQFGVSTINFNDNVTFKSNQNSTGIVSSLEGVTINGNVTVERYIPAKRAFRLLASSVNTTTTIRENWQNNGLEVSGIGTDITGTGGATNGFDETATNNPSMFTVDEAASPEPEYVAVDNTNVNTLNVGTGYLMLVRGDRTIDLSTNTPTPTPTTLTATGALHVGDFNVPTADIDQDGIGNASSLVANPYQAPVDMAEILGDQTDNINDQFIHVYDPTLGDRGAFVTVDVISNTNSFTFDDGGSGQMASASAASKILQVGQACFVNTDQTIDPLNPTASITFMESNKVLSTAYVPIFRPSNNTPELLSISLFNSQEFGENKPPKDGLVIRFAAEYSNDKDRFDAKKQFNLDENIATSIDDIISSIQSRALPTVGEEIALFTNNLTTSSYTLRVNLGAIENVEAYLVDNYTNSETALANNDATLVQFNVDEDIEESMASNRFKVIFKERVLSNDNVTASQFTIYPNPASHSLFIQTSNEVFSKGSVRIFNILGQSVLTSELTTSKQSIDVSSINSGVYLVKIDVEGYTVTKRIIIQ